jgi:hypothetical protein
VRPAEGAVGEAGGDLGDVDIVVADGGGERHVVEREILEAEFAGGAAVDLERGVRAAGRAGTVDAAGELHGGRGAPLER